MQHVQILREVLSANATVDTLAMALSVKMMMNVKQKILAMKMLHVQIQRVVLHADAIQDSLAMVASVKMKMNA